MLTLRRAADRGETRTDWLYSRHSFSFGDYHDPRQMGFGALRVLNEDRVVAGRGFPEHHHRDMEIVTYVLSGSLAHKDSLGTVSVIHPGEIQRMSAGRGITHSEYNASDRQACHFLQIWITPSKNGIMPSYEQKPVDARAIENHFARIAAADPRANEVCIAQDAEIWAAKFDAGVEAVQPLEMGRRAWIHVAQGRIGVAGTTLAAGDAAGITDSDKILIRADIASEVLLFDLA